MEKTMEQQPQRNTDHSTIAKRSTGKAITEKKNQNPCKQKPLETQAGKMVR